MIPDGLLDPARLWCRSEVLGTPSPVPRSPGVYAWYFDQVPPGISATRCHRLGDRTLLYVGISPKEPPKNGAPESRQTLRSRLRTHFSGNAAGSTLRLTLGCLLSASLGLALRRVGSGRRYTFTNPGERELDEWMARNAFAAWITADRPWDIERQLLGSGLVLPLNIHGNSSGSTKTLSAVRSAAKRNADALPILPDSGGLRRVREVVDGL